MANMVSKYHGLAAAMEKAGPACTNTESAFADVLKSQAAPTEHAVAEVFTMVAASSTEGSVSWNMPVLIEGLKTANPALDWQHVASYLDMPEFSLPDASAFAALMAAWREATPEPFPLRALIGGLWSNAEGQLSFIRQAAAAPPGVFDWAHAERQQPPLEGLHAGKSPSGTPNLCWLALDLYATLAKLTQSGHASAVRAILETPLKSCPELLVLGAAAVKGGWGQLQPDLVDALVATYVAPHPNSAIVLQHLWPLNPDLVVRAMVAMYAKDAATVARALDVCQELKALTDVLASSPPPFSLELAALAARREYLNLEKWLGEQCAAKGASFMQAAVAFLDTKLREDAPTQVAPASPTGASAARLNISVETLAVFLRVLASNAGVAPTDTLQQLKLVQAVAVQAHPELSSVIADAGGMEAFPRDVEEEANNTFSRMYRGEITVDALVNMLRGYKNSTMAREQEVFACMVHNMFDEFRFFFKYPEKELQTTALLFGQLVKNSLVSSASIGIAMRYVLDALRIQPRDKMFKFGITAAQQFKDNLVQYPAFAAQLAALPGLKDSEPDLFAAADAAVTTAAAAATSAKAEAEKAVENAKLSETDGTGSAFASSGATLNAAGFPTSMPAGPANPTMLFSTINAETLEHAAQTVNYPVPDQKTVDRVHFVVNNLASSNVEVKAKELTALVPSTLQPWFVNYLVVKRAAQEPNFHPVYVVLVDEWGDKSLQQAFIRTTVHYCKVMLASKLLKTNSSERTLLKNLGAWLGKLTLARNRPVLQRELDVKATIIEAYERGQMLPVLSFVRNLLEPCSDSKAFRPPNPWVMAILALLAEIYQIEGLKTSLKFEVELLFKQLDLQLADVQPSALLAGRTREMADNMDFQPQKMVPGAAAAAARPGEAAVSGDGKPTAPAAIPAVAAGPVVDPNLLASLPNFVVINPQLSIVGERLGLKRMVQLAVERAVVEVIGPILEKSISIPCTAAAELVLKDFANEPDAEAMRRAAHLCVTGLAQSMALVTGREHVRIAVANILRGMLAPHLEPQMLEQVVALLAADNLDICCQVIERAAVDRAQREIDERLAGAYAARVRAKAAGQPFSDPTQVQGRFPAALPEMLRARPGALTPQQLRVYQDFANIPRTAAAAAAQTTTSPTPARPGEVSTVAPSGAPGSAEAGPDAVSQLRSRFFGWLSRMDGVVGVLAARDASIAVNALPDGHEAKALAAEIISLPTNEMQAIEIAKSVFNKLYQVPTAGVTSMRVHASAYATALAALRDAVAPRLPAECTMWFTQLPDELRFAKEPAEALLRAAMFSLPDFDAIVAKSLAGQRYQPAVELVFSLLQGCMIGPSACISVTDLPRSLEFFTALAARFSNGPAALALVEEARRVAAARGAVTPSATAASPPNAPGSKPQDPPGLTEAVMKAFDRWARLLEESPGERVHAAFVKELRDLGLLGGEEATERFVRVMATLAVAHCLRSEATAAAAQPPGTPRQATLSFVAVDAFVRLMVCLVAQHGGGPALLSRFLGIVAKALLRDADERGGAFNGRPYFRMIVGFLSELSPADAADETGAAYLQAVAGFLHATRPLRVPAFAFPWLQLVTDRRFMPRLLMAPSQRGWPPYLQLLLAQLRFLEPFLRHAELTDAIRLLYKGTLRLLLVLLHDFPEFLCQFHFRLCDSIPPLCVQMRNLVLSAFPRAMRLPDPFTQDLKVDQLPEVAQLPRYSPPADALLPSTVRAEVDAVMEGRVPSGVAMATLRQHLLLQPAEALAIGSRYNAQLINAVVFYAGIRAVEASAPKPGAASAASKTTALELLTVMIQELDGEGRHCVINGLANHLRYPNAHTHWFSCAVLALFADAGDERIKEQITRVLLDRIIVNKPHPWGLLITFIELIKNPRFNFWSHSFTRVAPDIERVFESVARSCGSPAGATGGTAAVQTAA